MTQTLWLARYTMYDVSHNHEVCGNQLIFGKWPSTVLWWLQTLSVSVLFYKRCLLFQILYGNSLKTLGTMVSNLETDDFTGKFSPYPYPLLVAVNQVLYCWMYTPVIAFTKTFFACKMLWWYLLFLGACKRYHLWSFWRLPDLWNNILCEWNYIWDWKNPHYIYE